MTMNLITLFIMGIGPMIRCFIRDLDNKDNQMILVDSIIIICFISVFVSILYR